MASNPSHFNFHNPSSSYIDAYANFIQDNFYFISGGDYTALQYQKYTLQYVINVWIVTILSLAPFLEPFFYLYKVLLLVSTLLVYSLLTIHVMEASYFGM